MEARLLAELSNINKQIADLTEERRVIERLLVRTRRDELAINDVTRKNSVGRLLVEQAVLGRLKKSLKPVKSRELFNAAKSADYELKESTFRSHLFRMKKRGLIAAEKGRFGEWTLPESPSTPNLKLVPNPFD